MRIFTVFLMTSFYVFSGCDQISTLEKDTSVDGSSSSPKPLGPPGDAEKACEYLVAESFPAQPSATCSLELLIVSQTEDDVEPEKLAIQIESEPNLSTLKISFLNGDEQIDTEFEGETVYSSVDMTITVNIIDIPNDATHIRVGYTDVVTESLEDPEPSEPCEETVTLPASEGEDAIIRMNCDRTKLESALSQVGDSIYFTIDLRPQRVPASLVVGQSNANAGPNEGAYAPPTFTVSGDSLRIEIETSPSLITTYYLTYRTNENLVTD